MQYRFLVFLFVMVLAFVSCKKDDDGDGRINDTCTEKREFWIDGAVGDFVFVTSEPCGNLRLVETEVSQSAQAGNIFTFVTKQKITDSIGAEQGFLSVYVMMEVPDSLVETSIAGGDTVRRVPANNICQLMKLGTHYLYFHEALQNNTNASYLQYVDADGNAWDPIATSFTDSSIVVTSIDGIVSQSPFSGAFYPYCTSKFEFDVLMQKNGATDTLRFTGTARIGFR